MKKGPDNNGSNDNERSISSKKEKFVIPPGLYGAFDLFLGQCEVAENQPIMVVGDTGVGKSLFLHIFKKFYEDRCKSGDIEPKVIWANCAHFGGGHGNTSMDRSELFGYVEGSFTGAKKGGKPGLVEAADGGVLILDEIGELTDQVQAMLLTFIETGKYNKVGSPKPKKAKVHIIGATNNEGALRKDFRYRFFPFYVPALRERRGDILYYFALKFPELIETLTCSEVMVLLAYHWPGNVREINRVGMLMRLQKIAADKRYLAIEMGVGKRSYSQRLTFADNQNTLLNGYMSQMFYFWVSKWGGEKFLEPFLKKHGLALVDKSIDYPFSDMDGSTVSNLIFAPHIEDKIKNLLQRFEVYVLQEIDAFDRAYMGFSSFCGLFGQSPSEDNNILTILKRDGNFFFTTEETASAIILPRSWLSKFLQEKSEPENIIPEEVEEMPSPIIPPQFWLSKFPQENSEPEKVIPEEVHDFWSRLIKQIEFDKPKDSENRQEMKINPDEPQDGGYVQKPIDNFEMNKKQELKNHYENLLITTGGNVTKAANMAGLKNTTFRARCDKLGIPFRMSDRKNDTK